MPTETKAKFESTEDSLSDARQSAKAQKSTESAKHAVSSRIVVFFLSSHRLFKFRTTEDLSPTCQTPAASEGCKVCEIALELEYRAVPNRRHEGRRKAATFSIGWEG